jgi:hypothetical protein
MNNSAGIIINIELLHVMVFALICCISMISVGFTIATGLSRDKKEAKNKEFEKSVTESFLKLNNKIENVCDIIKPNCKDGSL